MAATEHAACMTDLLYCEDGVVSDAVPAVLCVG